MANKTKTKVMLDFQGTEIKVGDKVAYILKNYTGSVNMKVGTVMEIKGNRAYMDNGLKGVERYSIYKLEDPVRHDDGGISDERGKEDDEGRE